MSASPPPNVAAHLNQVFPDKIEKLLVDLEDESVDCIFADPDYNVGVMYQGHSYSKRFATYIADCIGWAKECERVLKPDGNFFIVNYPKNNAHLRARYLDEAFFAVQEYVWVYHQNIGHSATRFTTAHRSILHCTKTKKNRFYPDAVAVPYQNPTDKRIRKLIDAGSRGRSPYSWLENYEPSEGPWVEINLVKNVSRAKSFHSCQIPETLTEMLFRATTRPGDTVLVLFGGAGSELVVAERLGLNWLTAEIVADYRRLIDARLKNAGRVPEESRMLTSIRRRQQQARGGLSTRADLPEAKQ